MVLRATRRSVLLAGAATVPLRAPTGAPLAGYGAAARRLLHVGATRAIHQLWLTSVATPSPLVGTGVATQSRAVR